MSLILVSAYSNIFSQELYAEIITPSSVQNEDVLAIIVKIRNIDQSINKYVNGEFQVLANPANLEYNIIEIIKGVGYLTTKVYTGHDFAISIDSFEGEKLISYVNEINSSFVADQINTSVTWYPDSAYYILEDLTILGNACLTVEAGTRIFIGDNVNIFSFGKIIGKGTPENPVIFQSLTADNPWGWIQFLNEIDTSDFQFTIFTNGGGNDAFLFGHSNSQPVIMVNNSQLNLNNCFLISNPGKAIGGLESVIDINGCLIASNDTGGEYQSCKTSIVNSYFLDFPDKTNTQVDDDNDAIYFYGNSSNQLSVIDSCIFIHGKDDGIDHNGANLQILNCWIQDFDHEGVAASNSNAIYIYNSLVKNCQQGIEAGYGSPNVTIDHCVVLENETGIRFGDSYYWGCSGQITATNCILSGNFDNIKNYDLLTQGPVPDAIDISYSLTNDPEFDDGLMCINGVPLFDANYFLLEGSPGIGFASDGKDLGLVDLNLGYGLEFFNPVLTVEVYPNPVVSSLYIRYNLKETLSVYFELVGMNGNIVKITKPEIKFSGYELKVLNIEKLDQGVYFLRVILNGSTYQTNSIIKLQ
ncbi:MAG: right-handed parallel beta-helix repeat-containing protein [Bacteroidales bacterium]|nr:right-handed parallel beta-helix repeat-containing protein [Bacteroidales bacterium]MCF8405278.1 right-handed parallel beta-helix repeat-containing protein [Bacteroidales bacterium]